MEQILLGEVDKVDISKYADTKYDADQMCMIRLGLKNGYDITLYNSTKFDGRQMKEIYNGLQSGIDVSEFTKPELKWYDMFKIRLDLEVEKRRSSRVA